MKRILFVFAICILLVGCGTTEDTVTKEQVEEIVEQTIQEHEDEIEEAENTEDDYQPVYTHDGKFIVVASSYTDSRLVDTVINYTSYEVESSNDNYCYVLKCVNNTGEKIDEIRVDICGTDIAEACTLHNVLPDEEMVFEYNLSFEGEITAFAVDGFITEE